MTETPGHDSEPKDESTYDRLIALRDNFIFAGVDPDELLVPIRPLPDSEPRPDGDVEAVWQLADKRAKQLAELRAAYEQVCAELAHVAEGRDEARAQVARLIRLRDAAVAFVAYWRAERGGFVQPSRELLAAVDALRWRKESEFWHEQRDLAANAAATIADLDEVAPALRDLLRAEKSRRRRAEDERDDLQRRLDEAIERDQLSIAAHNKTLAERDQAIRERDEARAETERLREALPWDGNEPPTWQEIAETVSLERDALIRLRDAAVTYRQQIILREGSEGYWDDEQLALFAAVDALPVDGKDET